MGLCKHPSPSTYSMIDPVINEDGVWTGYDGYQTDILADQLVKFVQATPQDQPFFAMYSPTSPHMPSDDPRYDAMPITPPRDPSFDDDTVRDSAPLYARRPPLTTNEIESADFRYTRMARGVRSLDDSVSTILDGLGDRTRDTLVIYLSDNGFLFGEHRRFGKTDAYEGSVRVPMVIRYPACSRTRSPHTPWCRTSISRRRWRRSPGYDGKRTGARWFRCSTAPRRVSVPRF